MNKSYTMIKYLFVLPCLLLCFSSNVYGQTFCYPETNGHVNAQGPGSQHVNPASCNVATGAPTAVIPIPALDCATAMPITYETPTPPAFGVHYHYWGNCAPLSADAADGDGDGTALPTGIGASRNGFIQQMFCDVDVFNLPAWPAGAGGLSGESGTINFLPTEADDLGCNGFADAATTNCVCMGSGNGTLAGDGAELIQLDFWLAVSSLQSQVGFQLSGGSDDAGSFFVGPDLNNMCEVAYFTDGSQFDVTVPDPNDPTMTIEVSAGEPTGTYNINPAIHTPQDCGLIWMRVRLYINDVKSQWQVIGEIDAGSGFTPLSQLIVQPATSALDNTPPAAPIPTTSVSGYSVTNADGTFLFDENGVFDQYACNPVASTTDSGICGDPCDDPLLTADICASLDTDFLALDCDGDGETNQDECLAGTDPADPCSNSYADGAAVCAAITAGATGLAAADCDGGGVTNEQECLDGTDPIDPCDDTGLTGAFMCASVTALGVASPFHGLDCDGDGEPNQDECAAGTDPLDPCSNSYADGAAVCAAINAGGAPGLAAADCDGGGVINQVECDNGRDPLLALDDVCEPDCGPAPFPANGNN